MRITPRGRRGAAHLVTEAQRAKSDDISYRERRYLIMMGFRVVCFVIAVVLFAQGAGWLAAIPAVAAIVIPYFAVVLANGGRELANGKGFRAYEPRLPAVYHPPGREDWAQEQWLREQQAKEQRASDHNAREQRAREQQGQ